MNNTRNENIMRPEFLFGLFSPLTTLKGIGKKTANGLNTLCGSRVIDVLKHIPRDYTVRTSAPNIASVLSGDIPILKITIADHIPAPRHSKAPYRVVVRDATGTLDLIYFKAGEVYMKQNYPIGDVFYVSGRIEVRGDKKQIIHPDYIEKEGHRIPVCSPIYNQSGQITSKTLHKISLQCLDKIPALDEWTNPNIIEKHGWESFDTSLKTLHAPPHTKNIESARRRLAYDEILASQITIGLSRNKRQKNITTPVQGDNRYRTQLIKGLPYTMTGAQQKVLEDIYADMKTQVPMNRLLQGDVGSGKTLVALMSMLNTAETGMQSVLLAPTEVLATQHYNNIRRLLDSINIPLRVDILTGKIKGKSRDVVLSDLKQGHIHILIGTHAVFQDGVDYKNLGLCIIDEQHRFGVEQRASLMAKGNRPHTLSMTATPIPRTLIMTAFGDMETSQLYEKPAGRQPIDTRVMPIAKIDEMANALQRIIQSGQQIYWVCPLVEESEKMDLTAVEERYAYLCRMFGDKNVCLVHGKMKPADKQQAMDTFQNSEAKIMVATTVIEVGVDVPNATVMIIEQAERFGLSQLHQLRGRVGRGDKKSSCILIYKTLNPVSQQRLKVIRNTEDGFEIAEQDLKLRGAGDILGTKQSGLPTMAFADLLQDQDLLDMARSDAKYILHQNSNLNTIEGKNIRTLLHIFEMEKSLIGI